MIDILSKQTKMAIELTAAQNVQANLFFAKDQLLLNLAARYLRESYKNTGKTELIDINMPGTSDSDILSIDQIRFLKSVSPSTDTSVTTIFALHNYQAATTEAQNAFLKILEEPPAGTIFVLLCTSEKNLLKTIKSRAQPCDIQTINTEEAIKTLCAHYEVEDIEPFKKIALAFNGSLDLIDIVLQDNDKLVKSNKIISDAKDITGSNVGSRIGILNDYYKDLEATAMLLTVIEVILSFNIRPDIPPDKISETQQSIKAVNFARESISRNGNPKIILDNLILEL